jgi:calcium/calmodulin-dependent serine protein kinase
METPLWDPISEPAKDLIQRMLTTDVNHRITIQEVLNHKWLRVSRKRREKRRED